VLLITSSMRIISNTGLSSIMRPTANPQSTIRMPLNHILGTEANVRVLRVLANRRVPISAAEISRQTQLQRSTVSRTLKQLDQMGVIHFTGVAPRAQAALRESGVLAGSIRQLFEQEKARFEALLVGVQDAASKLRVISAWLGPSIGLGIDRPGDPVQIFVLDRPDVVATNAQALRKSLEPLEEKLDITFDVNEVTMAEIGTGIGLEQLEGTTYLAGVPPIGLLAGLARAKPGRRRRVATHADLDAAALERARTIADAIRRDPSIVDEARAYVESRFRVASRGEKHELDEWRRILKSSPAAIRKLLTDRGSRATRLRQTLPFLPKGTK
jgi:DNA-binding transcriptional ArsR family regulator